jgi:hypothetical protein
VLGIELTLALLLRKQNLRFQGLVQGYTCNNLWTGFWAQVYSSSESQILIIPLGFLLQTDSFIPPNFLSIQDRQGPAWDTQAPGASWVSDLMNLNQSSTLGLTSPSDGRTPGPSALFLSSEFICLQFQRQVKRQERALWEQESCFCLGVSSTCFLLCLPLCWHLLSFRGTEPSRTDEVLLQQQSTSKLLATRAFSPSQYTGRGSQQGWTTGEFLVGQVATKNIGKLLWFGYDMSP